VGGVEVDFERKTATVTTKQAKTISRASVEQALQKSGYGVTSFGETPASAPGGM
jgi:copper chaperone CopZ